MMLAGKRSFNKYPFSFIKADYDIEAVILEDAVPAEEFLRKRIKKLGFSKVAGQVLFQISIAKFLNVTSSKTKKKF